MKITIIILQKMRNMAFWSADFLKGSKVRNHFNDISNILENFNSSKNKRDFYLKELLNHAVKTTLFYKKNNDFNSLNDFKIIDKNIIRSQFEEFQSDEFLNKKNKTVSTSGSTGAALKVEHNNNKILRNTADSIYFSNQAGFKIGHKLLYLRNWDKHLKKSKLLKFLQNIKELEVVELNDEYISNLINNLKEDPSNKGWLGYPSGFELVCRYLDKINSKPIDTNVKSIITMSEGLNNYTKSSMTKYFKSPTLSRYSNMENGIIAQQTIKSQCDFTINWASYFIEILKYDEDEPALPGEVGRIIVTDLFNYATPLIRYDTGDIGAINYDLNPPKFTVIEGRKCDTIYNTKGNIISSIIITNAIDYSGVVQAQLIQENVKEYIIKLNVTDKFYQEEEIIQEFKGYLGNDAIIKMDYVKEIPVLSSGKRKATVNNYYRK